MFIKREGKIRSKQNCQIRDSDKVTQALGGRKKLRVGLSREGYRTCDSKIQKSEESK